MNSFYNNPINDKQMRANSRSANKIVQIASDAQKVITNSPVGSVRFIGAGDPHEIKNAQEGDVIVDSAGDIYLWCQGKWEIVGNNNYDFSMYASGRTNGKTMKAAAMQAAKTGTTNAPNDLDLFSKWFVLTRRASTALEKNKGIRILCTNSQIYKDPTPYVHGMGSFVSNPSYADMNIECTLRLYTVVGEDVEYEKCTAEVKFRGSDFTDGSYIDNEISIPPTLSKEDRYILRIAYVFKQVYKFLKGQADPNKPPRFDLQIHYEC